MACGRQLWTVSGGWKQSTKPGIAGASSSPVLTCMHVMVVDDNGSCWPGLTCAATEAAYAPAVMRVLPRGPPGSSAAPSAQALRVGSSRALRLPAEGVLVAGLCGPATPLVNVSLISKSTVK